MKHEQNEQEGTDGLLTTEDFKKIIMNYPEHMRYEMVSGLTAFGIIAQDLANLEEKSKPRSSEDFEKYFMKYPEQMRHEIMLGLRALERIGQDAAHLHKNQGDKINPTDHE